MKATLILALACGGLLSARADIVPPGPKLADIAPAKSKATAVAAKGSLDTSPFPHRREIGTIDSANGLFRVEADPALYRDAGPGFETLRLAKDNDGALVELPWIVRRVNTPAVPSDSRRISHRVESFDESPEGAIEIVVSLDASPLPPARFEIATPLRDFEKGVTVSVPGNGGAWTDLVGGGVVFDHSRFLDFRRTTIELPGTEARRFRIRIAEATDEQRSLLREITRTVGDASGLTVSESSRVATRAFRIDELRFFSAPTKADRDERGRHSHALSILDRVTAPDGTTHLLLDGGGIPFDRFVFATENLNFRRAASVQIPGEGEAWRTIHRGHLHRYEVGTFRDESLALVFPETRAERFRILVENGMNAPVDIGGVTGAGPAYELVFIAGAGDRPVSCSLADPATSCKNPGSTPPQSERLWDGTSHPNPSPSGNCSRIRNTGSPAPPPAVCSTRRPPSGR